MLQQKHRRSYLPGLDAKQHSSTALSVKNTHTDMGGTQNEPTDQDTMINFNRRLLVGVDLIRPRFLLCRLVATD